MRPDLPALLVIANSGRAIAESAVRGGYWVHVVDGFADRDTADSAECVKIPMLGSGLDLAAAKAAVEGLISSLAESGKRFVGAVYGAGVEAGEGFLRWLGARVPLFGNAPEVMAEVSDPFRFFPLLDRCGIPHPETRFDPPPPEQPLSWLVKAPSSSGGQGVLPWDGAKPRPEGPHCFQRHLDGTAMSLLFIADGKDLEVVGYNRLVVSGTDDDMPFLYGGAFGRAIVAPEVCTAIETYALELVAKLGLRGLNSLDFVLHQGKPFVLELNPRPSATVALYEDDCPEGWIRRHVLACKGQLPQSSESGRPGLVGQKILYAWDDIEVPDGLDWPEWCHDLPVAGTRIPEGAPLCSLLAEGPHAAWVEAELTRQSRAIVQMVSDRIASAIPTEEAL